MLRRALTVAMRAGRDSVDHWLLGRAIDEAADERERLRAFMSAELARYRSALPGSAAGFLGCLRNAVDDVAHVPSAEDLAALRVSIDLPCGERERASRAALLRRCTRLAENALEQRLAARARRRAEAATARATAADPVEILIPTRPKPTPEPVAEPAAEPAPAPDVVLPAPFHIEADSRSGDFAPVVEPPPAEADFAYAPAPIEADSTPEPPPVAIGFAHDRPIDPVCGSDDEPLPTVVPYRDDSPPPTPTTGEDEPDAHECDAPDAPDAHERAIDEPASNPAPGLPDAPTPEPLSPVIPHRRQSRALGQLPTPEILQAGTG